MKTNFKVVLVAIGFSFFSVTTYALSNIDDNPQVDIEVVDVQETTVKGVYQGHDDSGYNFSVVDNNGKENIVSFQSGDEAILKANDLKSESAIGKTFEITFTASTKQGLDASGKEIMQEIRTIKGLKALR